MCTRWKIAAFEPPDLPHPDPPVPHLRSSHLLSSPAPNHPLTIYPTSYQPRPRLRLSANPRPWSFLRPGLISLPRPPRPLPFSAVPRSQARFPPPRRLPTTPARPPPRLGLTGQAAKPRKDHAGPAPSNGEAELRRRKHPALRAAAHLTARLSAKARSGPVLEFLGPEPSPADARRHLRAPVPLSCRGSPSHACHELWGSDRSRSAECRPRDPARQAHAPCPRGRAGRPSTAPSMDQRGPAGSHAPDQTARVRQRRGGKGTWGQRPTPPPSAIRIPNPPQKISKWFNPYRATGGNHFKNGGKCLNLKKLFKRFEGK